MNKPKLMKTENVVGILVVLILAIVAVHLPWQQKIIIESSWVGKIKCDSLLVTKETVTVFQGDFRSTIPADFKLTTVSPFWEEYEYIQTKGIVVSSPEGNTCYHYFGKVWEPHGVPWKIRKLK